MSEIEDDLLMAHLRLVAKMDKVVASFDAFLKAWMNASPERLAALRDLQNALKEYRDERYPQG